MFFNLKKILNFILHNKDLLKRMELQRSVLKKDLKSQEINNN
jgi:hypothetical protein